ncbi:MAG: FlgD immunoglobulin-like domain containing protein [Candidatus Fermentibacteria bacterium]
MILAILMIVTGYFVDPPVATTLVYPPFGHCMGIYRAGTEQLSMLLGGLVRFDNTQGLACVKLDDWDDEDTADDDELAVYGVNSGTGHIIYNANMYTLGLYGGSGSDPDELMQPHGIAADPSGLVLVADTGNRRVVILRRSGSRLIPKRVLNGDFQEPWDVALDGTGRIYVTDRAGNRLYIYSSITDSLPETVELNSPTGVDAVRGGSWFHSDEEFIVVITDDASSIVQLREGEIAAASDLTDCSGSFFNYPAIDFWGNVWVTDSISCCVHKFTDNMDYICSFGSEGSGDREFFAPTGLAIWRRFGQVFIGEEEGARYFWIGADLLDVSVESDGQGFEIKGTLTEYALVDAMIFDSGGEPVFRLAEGRYPAGEFHAVWDGTTARGVHVPGGDYSIEVVVQPVYSSKGYFSKTFTDNFTIDPHDFEYR